MSFHIDVLLKSKISGVIRGVRGIKALADRIKKKIHDKHAKAKAKAKAKLAKASKGASHANNVPQPHQRRMLEEDDELESEGKFSDDEPYRQDIDAFIEHYLDNKLRKIVVAILKNLAEEEVSKSQLGNSKVLTWFIIQLQCLMLCMKIDR